MALTPLRSGMTALLAPQVMPVLKELQSSLLLELMELSLLSVNPDTSVRRALCTLVKHLVLAVNITHPEAKVFSQIVWIALLVHSVPRALTDHLSALKATTANSTLRTTN